MDYYIPGCPPLPKIVMRAVATLLGDHLAGEGKRAGAGYRLCARSVRARTPSRRRLRSKQFKRPQELLIDESQCLLAQGLLCLGPATRAGCEALCVHGNMPCTGCCGAPGRVRDQGAKALSAIASLIDSAGRTGDRSRPGQHSRSRLARSIATACRASLLHAKRVRVEVVEVSSRCFMPDATIPFEKRMGGSAAKATTDVRRRITIDPVTRLEGHGKIEIFLDDAGEVDRAYFQVPELRGFEKFVQGRPAEEMPQITSRICGVCPMAHHMAATKALDALYHVDPPEAAKKIRELVYCTFMVEDHALHFYYLGGPGLRCRARCSRGAAQHPGRDRRSRSREWQASHRHAPAPARTDGAGRRAKRSIRCLGLPAAWPSASPRRCRQQFQAVAEDAVAFATFTLRLFDDVGAEQARVLGPDYLR